MKRCCTCCRQTVLWDDLPLLGYMDAGDGGSLELRNCTCGSTLALAVSRRPAVTKAQHPKVAVAP
jgi:hypothetical protein